MQMNPQGQKADQSLSGDVNGGKDELQKGLRKLAV